ncbi:YeeE/YedE family protein [Reichenbachiella agarivorans]|uniref:YeeE/YedE family protein n=1 Tax=Reichenbachiella agarivorans TaxID=2979464 RepID=A0ABY6CUA5_9BACT|nr:YeeE/YedE family protein [Reichenbachiella agarivorans]UXP34107.1 YeeE/YedE family protein [Reichenbachiella agarivorans]
MIEWMSQPWPWYVGGPLIAVVMITLLFFGKRFGISSNLETMCSMVGAGRWVDYFNVNWKDKIWNLVFVLGTLIGGYIAHTFLNNGDAVAISQSTIENLQSFSIQNPGAQYLPAELFSLSALLTIKGWIMLVGGGLLVGFGTRYAGGCTSGHAITGLSNLELPSLIAVVGFFIGGLIMTHLILPYLLTL